MSFRFKIIQVIKKSKNQKRKDKQFLE